MNPVAITVVIPTHNRPGPLAHAVESVLRQSRPPDEIIVVDDGSEPPVDPDSFEGHPIRVRVHRHDEAMGVSAARNRGVDLASGRFVAFIDDDDTWVRSKLSYVEACLVAHPDADVVMHRTAYSEEPVVASLGCARVSDPLGRMIRSQPPHLDGVVVRRSLHLMYAFDEDLRAAEDLDYLIRLAKSGASMVEGNAVLAVFGEDAPSAIDVESRIEGRLSLLTRHPEILADRSAESFFYSRLGHLQRRGRMRSSALGSFLRAVSANPASGTAWKGLVRSLLP